MAFFLILLEVFSCSFKAIPPFDTMLTFQHCTRDFSRCVFAHGDHITLRDNNNNGENRGDASALVDQPNDVSDIL
jgi:hypothetical protein